jgi:DDT domain
MAARQKRDSLSVVKTLSLSVMTPTAGTKSKSSASKKTLAADSSFGDRDSRSSTPVSVISNGTTSGSVRPRSARIAAGGGQRSRTSSPQPVAKKTRRVMEDLVDDDECELGLEAIDETESRSDSNDEAEVEDDDPEFANDEMDAMPDESVSVACSEGTDSASVVSGLAKKIFPRRPRTPDFIFDDDVEIPKLDLPESSSDLLLTGSDLMVAFGIYEVLRRFRAIVRLSPFRFEDFCAALVAGNGDDQSVLLVDIHTALLRALLREDDGNNTTFGPYDTKDSVAISMYFIDPMTWYECIRAYLDSDISSAEFRSALPSLGHPFYSNVGQTERLSLLRTLTDLFLGTNGVRQELTNEGDIHHDDHCRACHKYGL